MKYFSALLMAALLLPSTIYAAEPKPAPESIAYLLDLTHAKDHHKDGAVRIKVVYRKTLMQQLGLTSLTKEQEAVFAKMDEQLDAAAAKIYSWDKVEPLYYQIYEENFTQGEIDAIIDFFSSPTGQAWLKKQPEINKLVMEKSYPIYMEWDAETTKIYKKTWGRLQATTAESETVD